MEKITKLNSISEFDEALKQPKVIVFFYTDWCPPCKRLKPFVNSLPDSHPNFNFYRIDRDHEPTYKIYKDLKLYSVPSFAIFLNGKLSKTYQGDNKEYITNLIQNA